MLVGYARVSTTEQHLDLQRDALTQASCGRILTDTASGAKAERPGLGEALDYVRAGDVLTVWKLDRLGRSLKDLIEIVTALEQRGIGFKSLQESMDTTTPGGKLIFHMFAALAEFERGVIRERTHAGLTAARARAPRGPPLQAPREGQGLGRDHAGRPQEPHRRYLRHGRHFARHAYRYAKAAKGAAT